jgi:PAS domain S-box-containing protein
VKEETSPYTELSLEDLRRRAKILDHLPVGILGADKRGMILSMSPQAIVYLGRSGPELKGKSIFDLVIPEDKCAFDLHLQESLSLSPEPQSGRTLRLLVDKTPVPFAISLNSVKTLSESITVIICLIPLAK